MAQRRSRRPKGRARERGETHTFTLELDPRLDAALEECAYRERRTKKAVTTLALEAYIGQTHPDLWPPTDQQSPSA
jgi:hypothetical protein